MKRERNPGASKAGFAVPTESFENKDAKEISSMTYFPFSMDLSPLDKIKPQEWQNVGPSVTMAITLILQ